MPVGIKDIAEAAGVSPATVSRVLAGKSVRPAYRERVTEALRQVDYRPNLAARRLRTPEAGPIGIIVPDLANSFFAGFVRVVENLAWAEGLRVIICNSNHDARREQMHRRLLEEERVSGLLIAPVGAFDDSGMTHPPTVVFDRTGGDEPCDTVALDNEAAAADLIGSLRQAGVRSVLGLLGDESSAAAARERGFARSAKEGGLDYNFARIPLDPQPRQAAVLSALAAAPDADAIVAINDDVLLEATIALGVRTRRTLACFDDAPWLRLRVSRLHIVVQPVEEIAHAALAMLVDRMGGYSAQPRRIEFPGQIVTR